MNQQKVIWSIAEGLILLFHSGDCALTVTVEDTVVGAHGTTVTIPCTFLPIFAAGDYWLRWIRSKEDGSNENAYVYYGTTTDAAVNADKTRYSRQANNLVISNFEMADASGNLCCEIQTITPSESKTE